MDSIAHDEFAGQSLRFVRLLLRCKARWPSAAVAARALSPRRDGVPPFMAVAFYDTEPYGHCGLSVGGGLVLTVGRDGSRALHPFDAAGRFGGSYLGWVPAEEFIDASEEKQ